MPSAVTKLEKERPGVGPKGRVGRTQERETLIDPENKLMVAR